MREIPQDVSGRARCGWNDTENRDRGLGNSDRRAASGKLPAFSASQMGTR